MSPQTQSRQSTGQDLGGCGPASLMASEIRPTTALSAVEWVSSHATNHQNLNSVHAMRGCSANELSMHPAVENSLLPASNQSLPNSEPLETDHHELCPRPPAAQFISGDHSGHDPRVHRN